MLLEIEPIGRFPLLGDSNFLFRAATGAIAFYDGKGAAEELICKAEEDKTCAITNPLPKIAEHLFVPISKQLFSTIMRSSEISKEQKKKIKKLEYAEIGCASNLSSGKAEGAIVMDSQMRVYKISDKQIEGDGQPHLQLGNTPHNAVPRLLERLPGEEEAQTQIYLERDAFYSDVKFAIYVEGTAAFKEKIKRAFEVLEEYSGLGHGRTTGRGVFKLEVRGGERLQTKKDQQGILISSLYPTQEEIGAIHWGKSIISAELCRTVSPSGLFRESALILTAGSLVCAAHGALPAGTLKLVNEGQLRGVYFGRALYV